MKVPVLHEGPVSERLSGFYLGTSTPRRRCGSSRALADGNAFSPDDLLTKLVKLGIFVAVVLWVIFHLVPRIT
jgi:hypothetical protein